MNLFKYLTEANKLTNRWYL